MSRVVCCGRRGVSQCAVGIDRAHRACWRVSVSVPRGNGPGLVVRTGLKILQVQVRRIAAFAGQPGQVHRRIGEGDGVVVKIDEGLVQVVSLTSRSSIDADIASRVRIGKRDLVILDGDIQRALASQAAAATGDCEYSWAWPYLRNRSGYDLDDPRRGVFRVNKDRRVLRSSLAAAPNIWIVVNPALDDGVVDPEDVDGRAVGSVDLLIAVDVEIQVCGVFRVQVDRSTSATARVERVPGPGNRVSGRSLVRNVDVHRRGVARERLDADVL